MKEDNIKEDNKYFSKSELKGDMLLKFKNGCYAFVWHNVHELGDYLMAPFDLNDNQTTRGRLSGLTDDLRFEFFDPKKKKLVLVPCIAIYGSNLPGRLGKADLGQSLRRIIWHRYRKVKGQQE